MPLQFKEKHETDKCDDDRDGLSQGFKCPEHTDRGSDDSISSEQCRSTNDEETDQRTGGNLSGISLEQAPQGKRSPFAPMVGTHDQQIVLQRQKNQGPNHQAQATENLATSQEVTPPLGNHCGGFLVPETMLLKLQQYGLPCNLHGCVENRGTDITVDSSRGLDHSRPQRIVFSMRMTFRGLWIWFRSGWID